jgi:hypothetical protein
MNSILITVDNLNIGGIQRIALDQLYCFSEMKIKAVLVCMEPRETKRQITDVDEHFYSETTHKVRFLPSTFFRKIKDLFCVVVGENTTLAICYSPKSVALLRIIRILKRRNFQIHLIVGQTPTLSSKSQNFKRAIFLRLADKIFTTTPEFKAEFNLLRRNSWFYKIIFLDDIQVARIGLYLPRIETATYNAESIGLTHERPLLFYGRIIGWKGFSIFQEVLGFLGEKFYAVVMTSHEYAGELNRHSFVEGNFRKTVFSKSVGSINWPNSAIHLYPTNYGAKTIFPMSISNNVLECMVLGIPSIVSVGSLEEIDQLQDSILVKVTTWEKDDVIRIIKELMSYTREEFLEEANRIKDAFSNRSYCLSLLEKNY